MGWYQFFLSDGVQDKTLGEVSVPKKTANKHPVKAPSAHGDAESGASRELKFLGTLTAGI